MCVGVVLQCFTRGILLKYFVFISYFCSLSLGRGPFSFTPTTWNWFHLCLDFIYFLSCLRDGGLCLLPPLPGIDFFILFETGTYVFCPHYQELLSLFSSGQRLLSIAPTARNCFLFNDFKFVFGICLNLYQLCTPLPHTIRPSRACENCCCIAISNNIIPVVIKWHGFACLMAVAWRVRKGEEKWFFVKNIL